MSASLRSSALFSPAGVGLALAVFAACSSSKRARPFGVPEAEAGASSGGSSTSHGGSGGTHAAGGASGENAAGSGAEQSGSAARSGGGSGGRSGGSSAGGEGGAGGPATGDAAGASASDGQGAAGSAPRVDPICARGVHWSEGSLLPISSDQDDLLQSVTPDGLSIAWQTPDGFWVADRDASTVPFGSPQSVPAVLGFTSVSLSADGLRLAGAGPDGFVEVVRAKRGDAFPDVSDGTAFAPLNSAVEGTPTNEVAVEPLLAADDTDLIYSFVSPSNVGSRPTLYESERVGAWGFGHALGSEALLWADGDARRVATGLSSDRLTLFYFDEIEEEMRAAWRPSAWAEFDTFESLGAMQSAAPNAACTELYYSAPGDGGLELFVATAE